jgi:hypothetical protein
MSETRDAFGPLLERLHADTRAVQRQMAMLQAGQAQLPTLDQFQAGLAELDRQFVGLAEVIAQRVLASVAETVVAVVREPLNALEGRIAAVEAKLP